MKPALAGNAECIAPVGAVLGEGPLYDPRIDSLLWVDIKGGKIFRLDLLSRAVATIAADGMVSALGLRKSGGYVCARRDGFACLDIANGTAKMTPIANPESALASNRFNDGKVDPKGGFWAGTMDDTEKSVSGSWWRLAPDGAVTQIDQGFHVTNGPAFDVERGRVYVTDSAAQTIFVADSEGDAIGEKRTFRKFSASDGYPDGMEVDREGCLWAAFWDGGAVRRFSPDGALIETLLLPVPRPTSVAIVADRLYVTSASVGLTDDECRRAPLSGGLFEATLSRPLSARRQFEFLG